MVLVFHWHVMYFTANSAHTCLLTNVCLSLQFMRTFLLWKYIIHT